MSPQYFIFLSWFYLTVLQEVAACFYILMRKHWTLGSYSSFFLFYTFFSLNFGQFCESKSWIIYFFVLCAVKFNEFFFCWGFGVRACSTVLLKNAVWHFIKPPRLIGSRCFAKHKAYRKHWMAAIQRPWGCMWGGWGTLPNIALYPAKHCQHTYAWKDWTKAPELLFLLLCEWHSSPFHFNCI